MNGRKQEMHEAEAEVSLSPHPDESREFGPQILVEDIGNYSGSSIPELARLAVESIVRAAKERPEFEPYYRETYGISNTENLEDGMRVFAEKKVLEFQRACDRKKEEFTAQVAHCISLAGKSGYTINTSPVRVVITDWFLSRGVRDDTGIDSYDHRTGVTYIAFDRPNILLAHEVGHHLSHSVTEEGWQRVGFSSFESLGGGEEKMHGLQWLNEGTTVLWENRSVNDGSTLDQRDLEGDFYPYSRDLTVLLLQETGIPEEILFKAYFGDTDAFKFVEDAIHARFHCSVEDLNCLALQLDIAWAKTIFDGEPVIIDVYESDDESIMVEKKLLARIFPNVILQENQVLSASPR